MGNTEAMIKGDEKSAKAMISIEDKSLVLIRIINQLFLIQL
jgi:hypothetical protein